MGAVESSGAGSQRSWVRDAWAWSSRHPLLLLVALGAAIRFATLTSQGFWLDEQVTVSLVQLSPIELLKQVIATESNPSLYYLLLGGWERVFGSGEFGIRSFSALAGTAAIPLVFLAAKSLYSHRAAVIAAAITATSPLLIWYSQEARNYELLLFFAALSFLCFAKALDDHGYRWLWAWALASAVALATHYFAFFLIVPEALWLLYRRPGSRIDTAIPMGAIVVVGLALLPLTATQRGRGDWIEGYDFAGRLFNVPEHFLVGYHVPWAAIPLVALGLVVAVGVYAAWRADGSARRGLAVTGSIVAIGFGLLLLASLAGDDYILTRNVLELWPVVAVLIAIALASPAAGRLGTATAVVLCIGGAALAIWNAVTPAAQRQSYDEIAAEFEQEPGNRLFVSQSSFSSPLILYLDGSRAAADTELQTSELIVIEPRPTENYAIGECLYLPTCGGVDVEPPPHFEPPPGFSLEREGATESFDYSVYTAPAPLAIERPQEYFTPRVFLQEGPG